MRAKLALLARLVDLRDLLLTASTSDDEGADRS